MVENRSEKNKIIANNWILWTGAKDEWKFKSFSGLMTESYIPDWEQSAEIFE